MNHKIALFPLKFFLLYWIITILMYFFSPWMWPKENVFLFILFNIFTLSFFYFGYKKGVKRFSISGTTTKFSFEGIEKLLNWSILLNIFFIYPKFLFRLKTTSASISFIYSKILTGIILPSDAYLEKHEATADSLLTFSNPLVLAYNLFIPLLYIAVPVGIIYWKKINPFQRISICLIVLFDILSYIAIGTNKGVFDYILILPWLFLIKYPEILKIRRVNLKRMFTILLSVFILIIGLNYFNKGFSGRKKDLILYESSIGKDANTNAFILNFIPGAFKSHYIALDNYLTQGYYALDKALTIEWTSTYGAGHSFFLTSIFEKYFGKYSISDRTYQYKLDKEYGFSQYGKWHSFYVSMANDLSFVGVIFLMYFIGYFFSLSWLDALYNNNIFAISVFTLFVIMLFYISANNQVLGFQGSSIIFWVLFIIWRIKGKTYMRKM